jgi:DNA polymerase III sliding clamp (beta) subunit (PCNA family)
VLGPEITMQFGKTNEMFKISCEDDPMVLFVMMPVRKRS